MKIGIVGGTYQQVSLPFDAQRSINLYPVMDEQGKEVAAMYGTPGLILFGSLGNPAIRAEFASDNGRAFAVCGSNVFEVEADGSSSVIGSLLQSSGICQMTENPNQLAICDGVNLYIFTYATSAFQRIVGNLSYITNGSFATNSGWTLGSGWTISGGYAQAYLASSTLTQSSPLTLTSGTTYTLQYTIANLLYVTNGNFTIATGWTLGSGWTINTTTQTAVATGAISTAISQTTPFLLISGQSYSVTFTVTRSAGSIACSLGAGTPGTAISASSTVTQTIVAGSTQILAFTGSAFTGTVTNITVNVAEAGSVVPDIGGTQGITRTTPGTYVETIIAGAAQDITFTGTGFSGSITDATVSDQSVGLPLSVGTITFIDDFFVVSENGTNSFFKSAPNDGTQWDALDFASASSSPDKLGCVIAAIGQLWLLGTETSEVWTNTGASLFPFQKIAGGKMTMGIKAPNTAIEIDNSLLWVGGDKHGYGMVYRANGFIPKRISTQPIETMIRAATDPTNIRAYVYQTNGHVFYILTGGGLATSLAYDITTDMWHERAYLNSQGQFEQHLGCCYMNAFGLHLVGDRTTGNIYIIDENTYTDNGQTLAAERIYTHIGDEQKRIRYNSLVIGVETGVGIQNGQGSDPLIELLLSVDGARTWSDSFFEEIGKAGEYLGKCQFRQLGVAEQMTFRIRITDPVKRAITGSYLN